MGSFEVTGVTKWFRPGSPVLSDLTFRYDGAGAIGYLGPNGSGKTTTLKLLVGLLRPSRGHATLNGIDPMVDRKRALWDVGALIESPEPYPTLNVFEALETVGRARGLASRDVDREVDRCNELLHLPPFGERIGWLSKGQRQRVALASALIGDPSVMLLDEPTSGLDPAERVLVRALLNRLKRDHLILMSSHQMFEVTEVCDQVVFLHAGQILLRERVDRVEDRIRSRQLDVEFAAPVEPGRVSALRPLAVEIVPRSDRRWRISFDGTNETRIQILRRCQEIGEVVQFSSASLVLEEAYLELIDTSEEAT